MDFLAGLITGGFLTLALWAWVKRTTPKAKVIPLRPVPKETPGE